MIFKLVLHDKIKRFEEILLEKARQEKRTKGKGQWLNVAEHYLAQKERLKLYPWPEEFNDQTPEEESPPIMKHIVRNTTITNLYRWGIPGQSSGNHRILYAIHNYHKVILVHYFDKQYNGGIQRQDIQPAEERYLEYCSHNPSLYPIQKGE